MKDLVYLRMKKKLILNSMQKIVLKDIAYLSSTQEVKKRLESLPIYKITKNDKNIVVIDSFLIIEYINKEFLDVEIQVIVPTHTIIQIEKQKRSSSILFASVVWVILFIGSAMTIMNFHYDVSMQEVQQKLHFLITGEKTEFPLWIQIPYSIGLGVGMLLFFNHWFNKRFNEEPSPLEIEIYNYQQNLDQYLGHYENKVNDSSH